MRCNWGIEGHKLFHVFVKYLGHFGNDMQLINIESRLGEVTFDYKSSEVL